MSKLELRAIQTQLPLPDRLLELIKTRKWKHPGDEVLTKRIPFIDCKLDFLQTHNEMLFESWGILAEYEAEQEFFSTYRGSFSPARDLPWIDVEKSIAIICNKDPGYDSGIFLNYRTGFIPRVVGTDWQSVNKQMIHREISPSFDDFLDLIGL